MKDEKKTFGYRLGEFIALTITICGSALLLGVTLKLILWLLF